MSMHPPSYPDVTSILFSLPRHLISNLIQALYTSRPCPSSPHNPPLLVRVAIHDRLRLLHVHSIPTWKPSTGTASEPSQQIYEQKPSAETRCSRGAKETRECPSPISHRLHHGPEPHQTTGDKLRSVASMAPKLKKKPKCKKRRDQKKTASRVPVIRQVILDRDDDCAVDQKKASIR